jgi:hypothetical protein
MKDYLLGYSMHSGRSLPTFRRNVLPPPKLLASCRELGLVFNYTDRDKLLPDYTTSYRGR